MRIAYVTETYPPEVNGVALTAARAVAYLRAQGHAVQVLRPRQAAERRREPTDRAGQAHSTDRADPAHSTDDWLCQGCAIPMYPELRFGVARTATLVRHFEHTRPELVHVATEGPLGWAAVAAARRLGLPVTSDFRTNFHLYSGYYRLGWLAPAITGYLRRFHNRTRRTFVPTALGRDALLAAGFERVDVVGRGVDLDRFTPARRDPCRGGFRAASGSPVLLYVGRLAAEKNVAVALRAFRQVARFVPRVQMVVVGDGPQRSALERDFPDAQFVGSHTGDALAAHYANADVFLFPSLSDTFGNVTLEALASGLPVVAYRLAAAAELVTDRVNGRLVEPGDEAGFAMAASLLASLHPELGPMREQARVAACACDWPGVLQRFERHLLDAADAHRPAGTATACVA